MKRTATPDVIYDLVEADSTARLIDVRTAGEFASQHIPGSINVPLDRLSVSASELTTEGPLVLVCQSGARASEAQSQLAPADTLVLTGGIEAWKADGRSINEGDVVRWAMDRQVRLAAGSLVLTGLGASLLVPGAVWLAAAVGAGLVFSAVTNTCTMAKVLGKLPYNNNVGRSCPV